MNPNHVSVLIARIDSMSREQFQAAVKGLPKPQQDKVMRFYHYADQVRALLGRMMINRLPGQFGFPESASASIKTTDYGRPYFDLPFDFNLSHGGDWVVCAASRNCRVGIDVEPIQPVDFTSFDGTMTPRQWKEIHASADAGRSFFHYWSMKEAAIKADGRGLSWPLTEMEVEVNQVTCDGKTWYVSDLKIAEDHAAYLATDRPKPTIEILEF